MATSDPRGRAMLRAYRKATKRPGEQREALWSRIEASLDARAPGPSMELESGRQLRPRVEPGPVRGGGWTTPVIVAAVAVAAAVVAVIALGPGERRHAASQAAPWAAPHEVEPGEPDQAARRRGVAGERSEATTTAVSADQDAVRRDAASAGGEASVPTDATRRDAVPPHADAAGSADVRIDASPPRRPARSGASELSTPSSTEVDELRAEMALIREARQALQADRPAGALEVLDAHARAFPEGQMREDRAVLRIEALCAAGKAPQARAEAQQFVRAFPRSAHAERVRATCVEP